jgi:hypothetical protein
MAVVKVTALTAGIVGAMMYGAAVRSDVNRPSSRVTTPPATSQVVKRLRPMITDRVEMETVATGFQTTEDFAAAVHAARNTRVPFTSLKYQMVDVGKTLPAAIQAVKPTADASLEADLARSEARADLESISAR